MYQFAIFCALPLFLAMFERSILKYVTTSCRLLIACFRFLTVNYEIVLTNFVSMTNSHAKSSF